MHIIEPGYKILFISGESAEDREGPLKLIEHAARTCYKSEDNAGPGTAGPFIKTKILGQKKQHLSVLEHSLMTVRFVVDRGVSHELVRHRLAAYSQESTRFCNYSKDKFGHEITVIRPCFWDVTSAQYNIWHHSCVSAEASYFQLLDSGAKPQEARSVLPNSLKTEVVRSANFRDWRHVFGIRDDIFAHPQMQQVMRPLHEEARERVPVIFDNSAV